MAAHINPPAKGHPAMDYAQHNRTYGGFLRATVGGVVLVSVLLIGMLIGLVP